MLFWILTGLYRLGFEKMAVRVANLVRYFFNRGKLLETAKAYLLSGGTGLMPCEHCKFPTLSDYDPNHERCADRFYHRTDLAKIILIGSWFEEIVHA